MAKKKIGVGIVGLGGIGRHHGNVVVQNPDAKLVALFDTSAAAREAGHAAFPGATVCESYEEFLDAPGLEAIIIGTPNCLHAQYSIAAAKRGLHVLCEKPLAMNREEGRAMVKAAKANGVVAMTNFSYRWVPSFRIARSNIAAGKFGRIHRVHVHYLQSWLRDAKAPLAWRNIRKLAGFGALGDLGSHMIDSACFVTGARPRRAVGVMSTNLDTRINPKTGKPTKVTTDTDSQFLLDFGAFTASFETSQVEAGTGNFLVLTLGGEFGTLRICSEDSKGYQMFLDPTGSATTWSTNLPYVEVPKNFKTGGPCAADFIKAIQGKLSDYPTFEDGSLVQNALDAIARSTKSNRWEKI